MPLDQYKIASSSHESLGYIIVAHVDGGMWEEAPIMVNDFPTREAAEKRLKEAKRSGEAKGIACKVVRADYLD